MNKSASEPVISSDTEEAERALNAQLSKLSYVSPYKFTPKRSTGRKKKAKGQLKPIKGVSKNIENLMKKIRKSQESTLSVSEGRLNVAPKKSAARKRTKKPAKAISKEAEDVIAIDPVGNWQDNTHNISTFMTGDDMSVGDLSVESQDSGSAGSFGSFGSLGSHISMVSIAGAGGKHFTNYEVDVAQSSTGHLSKQTLNLRMMIDDIERRARDSLVPPLYVAPIEDLPSNCISWHGRNAGEPIPGISKKTLKKLEKKLMKSGTSAALSLEKKPRVDLMGMYYNIPLILAKAEERCRKRQKAIESKDSITQEKREQLMVMIQEKMTRAERLAEALRLQQTQAAWMKLLVCVKFNVVFSKCAPLVMEQVKANREQMWAITTLVQCLRGFIKRKIRKRIKEDFMTKVKSSFWILSMMIRCKKKKLAMRKIKWFFTLFQGKNRIKFVIHKFVDSAHRIQRLARDYIVCFKARQVALNKLWDRVEIQYIVGILKQREEFQKGVGVDNNMLAGLKVNKLLKIELEKQNQRWTDKVGLMEELLNKHRKRGVLQEQSLVDIAMRMQVRGPMKTQNIQEYVIRRRRQHLVDMAEEEARENKLSSTFSSEHAAALLHGNTEEINHLVRRRIYLARNLHRSNKALLMYGFKGSRLKARASTEDEFLALIKKIHEISGTFVVKAKQKAQGRLRRDRRNYRKTASLNDMDTPEETPINTATGYKSTRR